MIDIIIGIFTAIFFVILMWGLVTGTPMDNQEHKAARHFEIMAMLSLLVMAVCFK